MSRVAIKPDRPSRVREASPEYAAASPLSEYSVTLADRGRLVLPAEVREQLHIKAGDRLTLRVDADGTIRLQTGGAFARSLHGMFKHLAPGRSLVDELIEDRRREAAVEDQKDREFMARHGLKQKKKSR